MGTHWGRVAYVAGVGFAWLTLARLIVVADVGSQPFFTFEPLLAALLLVVAPAATFVPLARWARAPLYHVEGTLGWWALGTTVTFFAPADPPTLAQFLAFLISLTVSLATAGALVSWLVGLRVYRDAARRYDFVRARRQGYLAAFCLIALGLLRAVGTLSPATGALLVAIAVLVEMFALGRGNARAGRAGTRAKSAVS